MNARLFVLGVVLFCELSSATADEAFVLTTDRTSATDGYWNTDQGYFVGCFYNVASEKIAKSDPGLVTVRLGLVEGGRLHPGEFGVGAMDLRIIGQMWLVVRERNTVVLRVPTKPEVDPGNRVHLRAQFNATAELLPRMEVEFEERLKSGNRRIRIPLTAFMRGR